MSVAIKKNIWLCYYLWQFFELHLQNKKYETWLLIYSNTAILPPRAGITNEQREKSASG